MDFKQIEAFVNVVRYKSFSKAADATFFTQPTISTHVNNLEIELGTKLLNRKGRIVEMTPQGSLFYKYAVEMINARSQAIDALGGDGDEVGGILEIQTSSVPGIAFLPEALSSFRELHRRTQFYVTLSDTDTVVDNLLNRMGEIGFVESKESRTGLNYTKIFSDKVVIIASKKRELGAEITLEEAMKYPFLWRECGSATRKSFEDTAVSLGYEKTDFEIAGLFNDLEVIVRAVEMGLGIAILSKRTAEALANDNVSIVEISDFKENRDFYMVTAKNVSLSPLAEAFKAFVEGIGQGE